MKKMLTSAEALPKKKKICVFFEKVKKKWVVDG